MSELEWNLVADLSEAEALLAEAKSRMLTGAEEVGIRAAAAMSEASREAFATKRDPRTGEAWAPYADSTRKRGDARDLLVGETKQLSQSVKGSYAKTPGGARAQLMIDGGNDVVKRGMIHLYGAEAKRTRARAKKSHRSRQESRLRWALPARRFAGLSRQAVADLIDFAEGHMVEGL